MIYYVNETFLINKKRQKRTECRNYKQYLSKLKTCIEQAHWFEIDVNQIRLIKKCFVRQKVFF